MATETLSFVTTGDMAARFPALDEVVRSLVSMSIVHGRFKVELPVMMPSGSLVSVTVWPEGGSETFLVTDDGAALLEVMAGGFSESIFARAAKESSTKFGATFDGGSMFYMRVSPDRLRSAIIAMANLTRVVVEETIHNSIRQKAREIDLELWEKLEGTFEAFRVERRAHLTGESSATHEFTAVVRTDTGLVAFDTFSAQGNSINSVFAKMADIGRNDTPPKGIAVTQSLGAIGPKLNLITSVAQVVEIGIRPDVLQKLALAA